MLKRFGYIRNCGLDLKSAYCEVEYDGKKLGENPKYSMVRSWNCLDYIFYNGKSQGVKVVGVLEVPKEKESLRPWTSPSDHLSFCVEFEF